MLRHERLELASHLAMAPCIQVLVDPLLQACEPLVLQAAYLRLREAVVGKVTERRPAPERQRLTQPARFPKQLEAAEIQLVMSNPEEVTGKPRFEPLFAEQLPEGGHVNLKRPVGGLGGVAVP